MNKHDHKYQYKTVIRREIITRKWYYSRENLVKMMRFHIIKDLFVAWIFSNFFEILKLFFYIIKYVNILFIQDLLSIHSLRQFFDKNFSIIHNTIDSLMKTISHSKINFI
jgi:hypothetical protein